MRYKINISPLGIFSAILILFVFLLFGCTTYKPATQGISGGYIDIPTDSDDLVMVSFSGNGFTPASAVNIFMLMRIADLAIKKGYEKFYLLDSIQDMQSFLNSYTYNQTQNSVSNVSGWSNGRYFSGTVNTKFSVPTTFFYTVNKASSGGVAILTNKKIEEFSNKPFYDAKTVYKEAESLNNQYKLWNYTQIGYTYTLEAPLGFQYGLLGGFFYNTFNFYLTEPDWEGHTVFEYISPSSSDTFTGDELTKKLFCFTAGTQIPIIKNILYLPIGAGADFAHKYSLYDEHYTYIDPYTWYKTGNNNRFILELGLMGRWRFLYIQSTFRLIGFSEPSFSASAGFAIDEF